MQIKKEKVTVLAALIVLMCTSCIKDITGMRNDLGEMKDLIDHSMQVVTEEVGTLNNNLATLSKTVNNSGVIKYSGGGWIAIVVGLFLLSGVLMFKIVVNNKNGWLLKLLTSAIQKSDKDTVAAVKQQLKIESQTSPFTEKDRHSLGEFAKKVGTFAEKRE